MDRYRTILRRVAAWLFDLLPFLPALVVGGIYYQHSQGTALGIAWTLALSVAGIAYSVYFHGRYGATPGKAMMTLRVVSAEKEEKMGFRRALLRESPWMVMGALAMIEDHWAASSVATIISRLTSCWLTVDVLVAIFHPKRRAIHDIIAGTVVVKEEPNQSSEPTPGLRPGVAHL